MPLPEYELPEPELIIEFDPPLQVGVATVARIALREPTGAEVRSAEGHLRKGISAESIRVYQMTLIQKVSGADMKVIDAMPISKITLAAEYLQAFVNPSQPTGNN